MPKPPDMTDAEYLAFIKRRDDAIKAGIISEDMIEHTEKFKSKSNWQFLDKEIARYEKAARASAYRDEQTMESLEESREKEIDLLEDAQDNLYDLYEENLLAESGKYSISREEQAAIKKRAKEQTRQLYSTYPTADYDAAQMDYGKYVKPPVPQELKKTVKPKASDAFKPQVSVGPEAIEPSGSILEIAPEEDPVERAAKEGKEAQARYLGQGVQHAYKLYKQARPSLTEEQIQQEFEREIGAINSALTTGKTDKVDKDPVRTPAKDDLWGQTFSRTRPGEGIPRLSDVQMEIISNLQKGTANAYREDLIASKVDRSLAEEYANEYSREMVASYPWWANKAIRDQRISSGGKYEASIIPGIGVTQYPGGTTVESPAAYAARMIAAPSNAMVSAGAQLISKAIPSFEKERKQSTLQPVTGDTVLEQMADAIKTNRGLSEEAYDLAGAMGASEGMKEAAWWAGMGADILALDIVPGFGLALGTGKGIFKVGKIGSALADTGKGLSKLDAAKIIGKEAFTEWMPTVSKGLGLEPDDIRVIIANKYADELKSGTVKAGSDLAKAYDVAKSELDNFEAGKSVRGGANAKAMNSADVVRLVRAAASDPEILKIIKTSGGSTRKALSNIRVAGKGDVIDDILKNQVSLDLAISKAKDAGIPDSLIMITDRIAVSNRAAKNRILEATKKDAVIQQLNNIKRLQAKPTSAVIAGQKVSGWQLTEAEAKDLANALEAGHIEDVTFQSKITEIANKLSGADTSVTGPKFLTTQDVRDIINSRIEYVARGGKQIEAFGERELAQLAPEIEKEAVKAPEIRPGYVQRKVKEKISEHIQSSTDTYKSNLSIKAQDLLGKMKNRLSVMSDELSRRIRMLKYDQALRSTYGISPAQILSDREAFIHLMLGPSSVNKDKVVDFLIDNVVFKKPVSISFVNDLKSWFSPASFETKLSVKANEAAEAAKESLYKQISEARKKAFKDIQTAGNNTELIEGVLVRLWEDLEKIVKDPKNSIHQLNSLNLKNYEDVISGAYFDIRSGEIRAEIMSELDEIAAGKVKLNKENEALIQEIARFVGKDLNPKELDETIKNLIAEYTKDVWEARKTGKESPSAERALSKAFNLKEDIDIVEKFKTRLPDLESALENSANIILKNNGIDVANLNDVIEYIEDINKSSKDITKLAIGKEQSLAFDSALKGNYDIKAFKDYLVSLQKSDSSKAYKTLKLISELLQDFQGLRYNLMLSFRPAFHGANIITAPFIMWSTLGGWPAAKSMYHLPKAIRALVLDSAGTRMASSDFLDTIAVSDRAGRSYTYRDIIQLARESGALKSQTGFQLSKNIIRETKERIGKEEVLVYGNLMAWKPTVIGGGSGGPPGPRHVSRDIGQKTIDKLARRIPAEHKEALDDIAELADLWFNSYTNARRTFYTKQSELARAHSSGNELAIKRAQNALAVSEDQLNNIRAAMTSAAKKIVDKYTGMGSGATETDAFAYILEMSDDEALYNKMLDNLDEGRFLAPGDEDLLLAWQRESSNIHRGKPTEKERKIADRIEDEGNTIDLAKKIKKDKARAEAAEIKRKKDAEPDHTVWDMLNDINNMSSTNRTITNPEDIFKSGYHKMVLREAIHSAFENDNQKFLDEISKRLPNNKTIDDVLNNTDDGALEQLYLDLKAKVKLNRIDPNYVEGSIVSTPNLTLRSGIDPFMKDEGGAINLSQIYEAFLDMIAAVFGKKKPAAIVEIKKIPETRIAQALITGDTGWLNKENVDAYVKFLRRQTANPTIDQNTDWFKTVEKRINSMAETKSANTGKLWDLEDKLYQRIISGKDDIIKDDAVDFLEENYQGNKAREELKRLNVNFDVSKPGRIAPQQEKVVVQDSEIDKLKADLEKRGIKIEYTKDKGGLKVVAPPFGLDGFAAAAALIANWRKFGGKTVLSEFADSQDAAFRLSSIISALDDGEDISIALQKGRRSLFDYGAVSDTERKWIMPYVLFWAFKRSAYLELMRNLLSNPSRLMNMIKINKAAFGPETNPEMQKNPIYLPSYMVNKPILSLAQDIDKGKYAEVLPGVPTLEALTGLAGVLVPFQRDAILGIPSRSLKEIFSGTSPEISMILESLGADEKAPFDVRMIDDGWIDPIDVAVLKQTGYWKTFENLIGKPLMKPAKPGEPSWGGYKYSFVINYDSKGNPVVDKDAVSRYKMLKRGIAFIGASTIFKDYAVTSQAFLSDKSIREAQGEDFLPGRQLSPTWGKTFGISREQRIESPEEIRLRNARKRIAELKALQRAEFEESE